MHEEPDYQDILLKTSFAELIVRYKSDVHKAAEELCKMYGIKLEHVNAVIEMYRWDSYTVQKIKDYELLTNANKDSDLPTKQEILRRLDALSENKMVDTKERVNA